MLRQTTSHTSYPHETGNILYNREQENGWKKKKLLNRNTVHTYITICITFRHTNCYVCDEKQVRMVVRNNG